jgi:hypothetical protein
MLGTSFLNVASLETLFSQLVATFHSKKGNFPERYKKEKPCVHCCSRGGRIKNNKNSFQATPKKSEATFSGFFLTSKFPPRPESGKRPWPNSRPIRRSGTDVTILTIFLPNNLAKQLAFFVQTFLSTTLVFEKKANFFRRKLTKISENC